MRHKWGTVIMSMLKFFAWVDGISVRTPQGATASLRNPQGEIDHDPRIRVGLHGAIVRHVLEYDQLIFHRFEFLVTDYSLAIARIDVKDSNAEFI